MGDVWEAGIEGKRILESWLLLGASPLGELSSLLEAGGSEGSVKW